jgi:hypothetical protein
VGRRGSNHAATGAPDPPISRDLQRYNSPLRWEREKKSPGGNIFRSGAHRTKNNGSFGKISILMAMFASVDYANQFGRAVRRQVPELKKSDCRARVGRPPARSPAQASAVLSTQITLYARAIYGVNAQIVGAALVLVRLYGSRNSFERWNWGCTN